MAERGLPWGRCEGCGEEVWADHGEPGAYGHTRAEHAPGCDGWKCVSECPVPVACGPITPAPTGEDPHREDGER